MNRKYIKPTLKERTVAFPAPLLQGSITAPEEGIGYGGVGNDDDDPGAKQRDDQWGDLW